MRREAACGTEPHEERRCRSRVLAGRTGVRTILTTNCTKTCQPSISCIVDYVDGLRTFHYDLSDIFCAVSRIRLGSGWEFKSFVPHAPMHQRACSTKGSDTQTSRFYTTSNPERRVIESLRHLSGRMRCAMSYLYNLTYYGFKTWSDSPMPQYEDG